MTLAFGICLADDSFCIATTSVKHLAKNCQCITATKVGLGFRVRRKFALVNINDVLHLACTVTGTLFNRFGQHHTEVDLWLEDVPAVSITKARVVRT